MFTKKTDAPQVELPNTIIGHGITLESALLTGKESIRIDGTFYGNVDLESSLILGDTGVIEGNVRAKYMIAAGQIRGNVECDTVLHVSPTARINGDIKARSIIVDEGGQLNGSYHVGESTKLMSGEAQPLLPDGVDATETKEGRPGSSTGGRSYLDKSMEIVDGNRS